MCIRKPEPEPETRFWIFQTRKPGFGRTAPGLETLSHRLGYWLQRVWKVSPPAKYRGRE